MPACEPPEHPIAVKVALELSNVVENVVWFNSVDSTHAAAIRLMKQVVAEDVALRPTLLMASAQSAGRGRAGRPWLSPQGGLYLNWLAAGFPDGVVPYLPMVAAAAAHRALSGVGVPGVRIKWPNDILVNGSKLAGLLSHVLHERTAVITVGLGVNLRPLPGAPNGVENHAISVSEVCDVEPDEELLVALASDFVRNLVGFIADSAPALGRWREALIHTAGDPLIVRLSSGETLTGRFVGLTDEGFLRLEVGDEIRVITGGDLLET